MNVRKRFSTAPIKDTLARPWIRKAVFLLIGLFVVFASALFFGGPPLLKSYLTSSLSKKLGRTISIGAVNMNPLTLSLSLKDFTLSEGDGKTPFVTFKEAYANAQLASLVFGGPVLAEVRLTEPRINLVRRADNTYNFQDLITRLKPAPGGPKKKTSKPLRFSFNNIRILSGRIDFDDRPATRKHTIQDLNVAIPFLSNLPYRVDDYVLPELSALINGAPFRLDGRSKPFEADQESSLNLKVSKLALTEYLAYVPKKLYFSLPAGTLDADLKISFVQPRDRAPSLQLSGSAALHDLAMNEAREMPVVRLKSLDVALNCIEPLSQRFTVDRVALEGLELFVRRDRRGRLNLTSLVEPGEEKKPLPYFLLKEGSVGPSVVHVLDDSRTQPVEVTLKDVRLLVRHLTSEKGKAGQVELSASGPGSASVQAAADVTLEPFAVGGLNARLEALRLPLQNGKPEIVSIGSLAVTGASFEMERRNLLVSEISLRRSRLFVHRNGKGELNLREMAGSSRTASTSTPAGPAWQYALQKVALDDIGVRWRDEIPSSGTADIGLQHLSATVENLSSRPDSSADISLNAQTGRSGTVRLAGSVVTTPRISAKLRVKASSLPILPVQPYFADKVQIRVTGGTVSAEGALTALLENAPKFSYRGDASVNRFSSVDNVHHNDFLKWETLHVDGIRFDSAPLNVDIQEISLKNFYSRLIIHPDGSVNVQHILDKGDGSMEAPAEADEAASSWGDIGKPPGKVRAQSSAPSGAPDRQPPAPVRISRVSLEGGQVRFSDRFIKPNYSANLTRLGGRIVGLSSNLAETAAVDIHGSVDGAAPVIIQGRINPLSENLFLDLTAVAKGVDLPTATPYSSTYAGYPIIKGKLSMDVHYVIKNRKLVADNRLVLDQLTFGDKVESPKATNLPVLLAVALLKDRHGVIDVNLPVSGSLDDPKFSVGAIILKVIVNLISKAVTAPFALLGSLVGAGAELSYIEFAPGRSDLDQNALDKISSLSRALEDRPALHLDVAGRIDPVSDRQGLQRRMLEHKVKRIKLMSLSKEMDDPTNLDELSVDRNEYPMLLKQVYRKETFPKPRNLIGFPKDLPVPEMENLILSHTKVTDDDLRQLGLRRARVVADAILKTGKVTSDRVFVLEPNLKSKAGESDPAEKAKMSRVDFSLK